MKFIQNAINRIFNHWQTSLFGLSYAVIFFLIYKKDISTADAVTLLTAILGFKAIFVNKDPDKTQNKPDANP